MGPSGAIRYFEPPSLRGPAHGTIVSRRLITFLLSLSAVLLSSACAPPMAQGDANALIVAADPALWADVEPRFRDAMAPTIQAVTNERPFRITHQDPMEPDGWSSLRRFRQVLVLGSAGDPWVDEVLAALEEDDVPTPADIVQTHDVWASGQLVSLLLLPRTGQADAVASLVDELHDLLDSQFRQYARDRMFVSGENAALADSLARTAGFSLRLPAVYRYLVRDSVYRFRNDNPSPSELIRQLGLTWTSPIPDELPTRSDLANWRRSFTEAYYIDPQRLDTAIVSYGPVAVGDLRGVEYQSAWASLPGAWPAGGPFIARALPCPEQDRLYLMDAWLYAPNRDKYEYMIQLQTILDSFRCVS